MSHPNEDSIDCDFSSTLPAVSLKETTKKPHPQRLQLKRALGKKEFVVQVNFAKLQMENSKLASVNAKHAMGHIISYAVSMSQTQQKRIYMMVITSV